MLIAIIAGVYHVANRSIKRCTGTCASCASSTRRMMRARAVSAPTLVARTSSTPVRLTVPAKTDAPPTFSAGRGSPVIVLSSTVE